ncbi:MAG: YybH family protein [Longimicrobiales bacterium]
MVLMVVVILVFIIMTMNMPTLLVVVGALKSMECRSLASRSDGEHRRPVLTCNWEDTMRSPRTVCALVPIVLALHACAPPATPGPTLAEIETAVRARSEALVTAEEAFDFDAAVTYLAPDVVVQPGDASQYQGREAQLQAYRSFPPMLEFESTATAIIPAASGDMAYEYGVNRFVFDTPAGPMEARGKYLVVWTKAEGEWFVTVLSFSGDSPPQG